MNSDWAYPEKYRVQDRELKHQQKANFNRCHSVHPLPVIPDETDVWITTDRAHPIPRVVVKKAGMPSSYLVDTESGAVRRNRRHLNVVPSPVEQKEEQVTQQQDESSVGVEDHKVFHVNRKRAQLELIASQVFHVES